MFYFTSNHGLIVVAVVVVVVLVVVVVQVVKGATNLKSLCYVGFIAAKQWKSVSIYHVSVLPYILLISVSLAADSVDVRAFHRRCDTRLSLSDM